MRQRDSALAELEVAMLSPCRLILFWVIIVTLIAALCLHPVIHLDADRGAPDAAAGETNQTALGWLRGTDPVEDAEWRAFCNGVLQRGLAKGRLAADVAAGRLTLLEAAAAFRDLNRQWPPFDWDRWRRILHYRYPGVSDEEALCRQVIDCTRTKLWEKQEEAEKAVRRLEAELDEHLRHGTLRLPPVVGTENVKHQ
jgi:hypothetical protein